ncbi:MAG: HAD family hydrolase [Rubrobacteraceae bacterium]|nr:HAD family hydrolase [Rubrobacteraceae bacterium]
MKPTLCIDVDSTIWDTGAWVCAAVLEVTGETLDVNEVTTWTHVLDTYGEETTTVIFDRVFDPARIHKREPYPGAREVLRALQESPGIRIHFVTHNDPEIMPPLLGPWLETHFGPNVGLTVTMDDKLAIIKELEAFGLIDDRPDTIERVADAGLWAATKLQPWNRDLVARRSDVHSFHHWQEVPALLPPQETNA